MASVWRVAHRKDKGNLPSTVALIAQSPSLVLLMYFDGKRTKYADLSKVYFIKRYIRIE